MKRVSAAAVKMSQATNCFLVIASGFMERLWGLTPKLTHSRWQRARVCNDSSRAGRNRQTESLSGCCVQRLVRHEDIHTAIHSRTHPQTLATQPPLGTRGGKTVRMVAGVCWHVACPAGAMTAHACGDAFTSERLPTLRSARLSKALTPPATLDNSLISAFLPNARAQAPPPETDAGCKDDVQISWPRQN